MNYNELWSRISEQEQKPDAREFLCPIGKELLKAGFEFAGFTYKGNYKTSLIGVYFSHPVCINLFVSIYSDGEWSHEKYFPFRLSQRGTATSVQDILYGIDKPQIIKFWRKNKIVLAM